MTTISSQLFKEAPGFDPISLLEFADVMENLHTLQEIDIVPQQFVAYMKEEKKNLHSSLVEYTSSLVAVVDGKTLLVYFESVQKFYPTCIAILQHFREKVSHCIPQEARDKLTAYRGLKTACLLPREEQTKTHPGQGLCGIKLPEALLTTEGRKYLYLVDIASRILLCYNGELNMNFNIRIDLLLLGQAKDYEKELCLVTLANRRYKKSSVAWHYRKVTFMLGLSQSAASLLRTIQAKPAQSLVETEDFESLRQFWERESSRLESLISKHGRSYKIWEYLLHAISQLQLLGEALANFPDTLSGETGQILAEDQKEAVKSEGQIFRVQLFSGLLEQARGMAAKNIHNHCLFGYIMGVLRVLAGLGLDEFMESEGFFKGMLLDHCRWIDENRVKYVALYGEAAGQTPMEKERAQLESLHAHEKEFYAWALDLGFDLTSEKEKDSTKKSS